MVDSVVLETINNMRNSGVSDSEIKSLLKSMGYEDSDINEALGEQKEYNKEDVVKEDKVDIDTAQLASSLAMNVSTAAVSKIEKSREELEDIKRSVLDLSEKHEGVARKEQMDEFSKKHDNLCLKSEKLEEKLDDLSAKINTLLDIMKKILDSQRDILMKKN